MKKIVLLLIICSCSNIDAQKDNNDLSNIVLDYIDSLLINDELYWEIKDSIIYFNSSNVTIYLNSTKCYEGKVIDTLLFNDTVLPYNWALLNKENINENSYLSVEICNNIFEKKDETFIPTLICIYDNQNEYITNHCIEIFLYMDIQKKCIYDYRVINLVY